MESLETRKCEKFSPLFYQEIQKATIEQASHLVDYKPVPKVRHKTFEEFAHEHTLVTFATARHYSKVTIEDVIDSVCKVEKKLDKENNASVASNFQCLRDDLKRKLKRKSLAFPHYIFFYNSIATKAWTLTVILEQDGTTYALHKHPKGTVIDPELKSVIQSKFSAIKSDNFISNKFNCLANDQSEYFSGPIAIRNMVKINYEEQNVELKKKLIADFENMSKILITADMVKEERMELAKEKAEWISTADESFVMTVFYNRELYVNFINCYYKDQRTTICRALEKANFENISKISALREECLKIDQVQSMEDNMRQLVKIQKKGEIKLDMQMDYPKETDSITKLFILLSGLCFDETRNMVLHQLVELFQIHREMDWFYEARFKIPEEPPPKETVDYIFAERPKTADRKVDAFETEWKRIEQVASETSFGYFTEIHLIRHTLVEEYDRYLAKKPQAKRLIELYALFKRNREKVSKYTSEDVHREIRLVSDKLNSTGMSEILALIERAMQLKKGITLLMPQVLAIYTALRIGEEKNAKLLELLTGEGKSVTISVIAIILALRGAYIDVVTSNNILANEAVANMVEYANVVGLSVGAIDPIQKILEKDGFKQNYTQQTWEKSFGRSPEDAGYFTVKDYSVMERLMYEWEYLIPKFRHNIVYGTMSSYQYAYLQDRIEPNGDKGRRGRKFGFLLIDEADNVLIDNATKVARVTETFPGLATLTYIYINIWKALNDAVDHNLVVYSEKVTKRLTMLQKTRRHNDIQPKEFRVQFRKELKSCLDKLYTITERIKDSDPLNLPFVPEHIRKYAEDSLDKIIEMAYYAKFVYRENVHYELEDFTNEFGDQDTRVVPMDYKYTGLPMEDTVWACGLHQFIQLKHNLNVTFENFTTAFISNTSYVKLYDHSDTRDRIFAMMAFSANFGRKHEIYFLRHLYTNVEFYSIPSHRAKTLNILSDEHTVVEDEFWHYVTAVQTIYRLKEGRSVLVVCESPKDIDLLKNKLEYIVNNVDKKHKHNYKRLTTASSESEIAAIMQRTIDTEEIILATNVASRGADFRTSAALEKNGGLHVTVGFLPYNTRIERQLFGRTARQGNAGSASIMGKMSDIKDFHLTGEITFDKILKKRTEAVSHKNTLTAQRVLNETLLRDHMTRLFLEFYHKRKKEVFYDASDEFLLRDMREEWAMWMESKKYKKEITDHKKDAEEEFAKFVSTMTFNTLDDLDMLRPRNVYNDIAKCEYYKEIGDFARAQKLLDIMNRPEHDSRNFIAGYYLNRFEVAMESGYTMCHKLQDILGTTINFKLPPINSHYLEEARAELKKAKKVLRSEIGHLEWLFSTDKEQRMQYIYDNTGIHIVRSKLTYHLMTRLKCLVIILNNVRQLMWYIKKKPDKGDIFLEGRLTKYFTDAVEMHELELDDTLKIIRAQFVGIGLSTLYTLNVMPSKVEVVGPWFHALVGHTITMGILGCIYVWMRFRVTPIISVLLAEGLSDFYVALTKHNCSEEASRQALEVGLRRKCCRWSKDVWDLWYKPEEVVVNGLLKDQLRYGCGTKEVLMYWRKKTSEHADAEYNFFEIRADFGDYLFTCQRERLKLSPIVKRMECVNCAGKSLYRELYEKSDELGKERTWFEYMRDEAYILDYFLYDHCRKAIQKDPLMNTLTKMGLREFDKACAAWIEKSKKGIIHDCALHLAYYYRDRYANKVALFGLEIEPLNWLGNLTFFGQMFNDFSKTLRMKYDREHNTFKLDDFVSAERMLKEGADFLVNTIFKTIREITLGKTKEPEGGNQRKQFLVKANDVFINLITHSEIMQGHRNNADYNLFLTRDDHFDKITTYKSFLLLMMRIQPDVAVARDTDDEEVHRNIYAIFERRWELWLQIFDSFLKYLKTDYP